MDVDNLLALSEAASPGPWSATEVGILRGATWIASNRFGLGDATVFENPSDAEFMIAAREHFPELLRRFAALQKTFEPCRGSMDRVAHELLYFTNDVQSR